MSNDPTPSAPVCEVAGCERAVYEEGRCELHFWNGDDLTIRSRVRALIVGIDEDGDDMTSCVVEAAATGGPQNLGRLMGNAKRGFDVLCAGWPDNKPADPLEWRDACSEFLNGRNVAQRFYDIKKGLLQKC